MDGLCARFGDYDFNTVYLTTKEENIPRFLLGNSAFLFPPQLFLCTLKVFGKKLSRDRHARDPYIHGKVRPKKYKCKFCSKTYSHKDAALVHEQTIHLNVKKFKCDSCDYATASKGKLRLHKISIHDGVLYYCNYPACTKSYNLKGNLDAHRFRVHKIARPKKAQSLDNN